MGDRAEAEITDCTVFAAASLKNTLDNAGKAFTAQTGTEIKASYAASSALARQTESGAPADRFAKVLGADGRLATGEVSSGPVGKYAKAGFGTLGLWTGIQPRLAQADNVRAALAPVSRGEAPWESSTRATPGPIRA